MAVFVVLLSNNDVNPLTLSGYYMYHQVSHSAILRSAHTVYVFCVAVRTNSDYVLIQYELIGFYNRAGIVFTARYELKLYV